jgi:hypothetical protein
MSISFSFGSYFSSDNNRSLLFTEIYKSCLRFGFSYLPANRYGKDFNDNLEQIKNNERNNFWIQGYGGELLVAIGDKPQSFGFPNDSKKVMSNLIFDYYCITGPNDDMNMKFLENTINLQIEFYALINADLCWAGYDLSTPTYVEYDKGKINALRWFNVFGKRFVEKIGRNKLMHAPGWKIKELPDGSVIVRLSKHPDIYDKVNGEYLHEYLGLDILR